MAHFFFPAPFLLHISLSPSCFIGSSFIPTLQFLLRSGYLVPYHLFVIPLIYSPILYLESPPAPLFATLTTLTTLATLATLTTLTTLTTSCFVPFLFHRLASSAYLLSQPSGCLSSCLTCLAPNPLPFHSFLKSLFLRTCHLFFHASSCSSHLSRASPLSGYFTCLVLNRCQLISLV